MGQWLGKYEMLRPIGKGGMAELHLARVAGGIAGAHKLVVVKQMLPWLADDAGFVQMFVDEARLALTLDHPNVVHVYDVGASDGRYYFAMEYLHGEDVGRILGAARAQKRPVALADALAIGIGVASGLHYAHDKRALDGTPLEIVHRDVSPQNVVVTFDGAVKLLDFGIAKAAHRLTETRQGTIKGKVRYMAPEQIRCEPLDRRADVFALGVLLWELTTGQPLYQAPSEFALQRQIVDEDARRPSSVVADYPPEIERVVLRAVARRRQERFDSAEALQLALEEVARERKLGVSSVSLARYVRELFASRAAALEHAQAAGDDAVTEAVLAELDSRPSLPDDDERAPSSSSAARPGTRRIEGGLARTPSALAAPPSPIAPSASASAPSPVASAPSASAPSASAPSRRSLIVASLATAIVTAAAAVLVVRSFAPPTELPPPPRIVTAARVDTPVHVDVPQARPSAPSPPARHAPHSSTRAAKLGHKRATSPAQGQRWDDDSALPPP